MTPRWTVLDAPSNLGLRPPAPGTVPGCHKLAGALRDNGLVSRLGAGDAGCVTPPRYDRTGWSPGDGVFNAAAMAAYTRQLAARIGAVLDGGAQPVVLGGDCSIVLGPALALRRRGRYGLVYLDGHSDFRHTGNTAHVGAAGGEGTTLVTGRGQADLTDIDGLAPYVRDDDLAVVGVRPDDDYADEMRALGILTREVADLLGRAGSVATEIISWLDSGDRDGFWVHLDVDILDPAVMPAVDSPDPPGMTYDDLVELLGPLSRSPRCVGVDVAIFDPDLDPDGRYAVELTDAVVAALG